MGWGKKEMDSQNEYKTEEEITSEQEAGAELSWTVLSLSLSRVI